MNTQEITKEPVISILEITKTCAIGVLIPFAVLGFETFLRFMFHQI